MSDEPSRPPDVPSETFYLGLAVLLIWEVVMLVALHRYWLCGCCTDARRRTARRDARIAELQEMMRQHRLEAGAELRFMADARHQRRPERVKR